MGIDADIKRAYSLNMTEQVIWNCRADVNYFDGERFQQAGLKNDESGDVGVTLDLEVSASQEASQEELEERAREVAEQVLGERYENSTHKPAILSLSIISASLPEGE